jgi:hypothetical protein
VRGAAGAGRRGCAARCRCRRRSTAGGAPRTQADRWYLRLTCERFGDGHQSYANGSLVYGPGRGTSIARCPHNTEIVGTAIAYL